MTTDTQCRRCGTAVASGLEFCPSCGLSVTGDAEIDIKATQEKGSSSMRTALDEQVLIALRDVTLGEYEILSELGRGGMATVYLAHEIALNRKVAIKVISPHLIEDNTAERFLREARTAAALSHPNLIPIFSVRQTDTLLFFVMKYVAGPTLETLINDGKQLSVPVIQTILSETASALGYAHRRQIVHRDVKPGNIMLDEEGRVVITDFGIARDSQSTGITGTGMSVGTPMYMSPEQCLGEAVSGASDQYSLGIVGYQLLAGKVPFDAPNAVAMMYAHMHTAPKPLSEARPDCPPGLAAAVMRMLEKTAADRWPTIEEANKAIGAPPLVADDPVRQTLTELARASASAKLSSLPSTPRSPVPSTRNVPRRPARAGTPQTRVSTKDPGAGELSSPTVHVAKTEVSKAATPRRAWLLPVGAGAAVVIGVALWFAFGRRASPSVDANSSVSPPAAVVSAPLPPQAPGNASEPPRPAAPPAAAAVPAPADARVAAVAITPMVPEVRVGEKVQLRAQARDAAGRALPARAARWLSSDPRIASVTSGGVVDGLAEGRAVISASIDDNSSSMSLMVVPAPAPAPLATAVASVEIIPSTLTIVRNTTGQLKAILHDGTGKVLADRPLRWVSANPLVADVSTNGLVIGVGPGTTQITASAEGRSASATVMVPAPMAGPAVAPPDPRPAIRHLIDSYVAGISARNVTKMIAVYPTLSPSSRALWDKLFDDYPQVDATIVPESVDIAASGESAAFDVSMELTSGREHQKILMHFLGSPEQAGGAWRFRQVVQSYVKQ
jgi:serine/threonine-protein kinase